VKILANTATVQAVRDNTLGLTAANFWGSSGGTAGALTCNGPAAAVIRRQTNGNLEIAVSDPTWLRTTPLLVTFSESAGVTASVDPAITVISTQPTLQLSINPSGARGRSLRASFVPGTPPVTGNGTWTLDGNGVWTIAGNWQDSIIASGADRTAFFSADLTTATRIVTLGENRILGHITFSNDSHDLTITGNSLNLDVATGPSTISVSSGRTLNLTGTFVSGSSLRFGTGSDGLTSAQLLAISATGFSNFGLNDSGFLIATPIVTDNYLSWANANGVTGGENGDSNRNGVPNLVEYALMDGGERGALSRDTLTFTKRGAPYGNDLSCIIETSEILAPDSWSDAVTHSPGDPRPTISHTYIPGSPPKDFARLKVTRP
jgi:hypothetical protein